MVVDKGAGNPQDCANFDVHGGNIVERMVFNHRCVFILLCVVLTAIMGFFALRTVVNASFDSVIPQSHPYIQNYFENRNKLGGLGNVVRVVIESRDGDIFDPAFLAATKDINDKVFLMPGVDRAWMKSIWMSSVRWTEVTEAGFRGGPVMPALGTGFTPHTVEQLKQNIRSAGVVGSLVGTDFKSIMIVVPLLEFNPQTGERLDYGAFAKSIEQLRQTQIAAAGGKIDIKIIGFAKLVGDLIEGLIQVMSYFAAAAVVSAIAIYLYSRCIRSTLLVIGCSVVAVIWLLGCVRLLGYAIDPYSILVPFLVFAIGVSHGAQKMNGIMQDVGRGVSKYIAARFTFRRLFLAGLTALLADAVGFAVLMVIDIPSIKVLATTASIGVGILIITNLLLLPVMLSYVGVSVKAAQRSLSKSGPGPDTSGFAWLWSFLMLFTRPAWAWSAIIVSAALFVVGYMGSLQLKIGDLDPGAPEMRQDSRYNQDIFYVNDHYKVSNDQFVVIATTPEQHCADFNVLKKIEDLTYRLRQVPGVRDTMAFSDNIKSTVSGFQEGNPKWYTVTRNQALLGSAAQWVSSDFPEVVDTACSTVPVFAYLKDHKAETLQGVVKAVEQFAAENDGKDVRFLLAAGPAGIEAVTNIIVSQSMRTMLYWVYGAVAVLCLITFRSWRATLVALVPLVITSILAEGLMAMLGIGVKVATLPVVALGVGIGVDYALYLLSVQLANQRAGMSLAQAYRGALGFTGRVVALIGVTLAAGVVTWIWSPIKFQADMGILLTFMFLWNMVGALILIPALSHVLLRNVGASAQSGASAAVPSCATPVKTLEIV
ncbi:MULTISPECIES: efflux RND transporter permease subunit [Pseudomonas]|uniref:efflux RND transporter permease subunit n=1 Tax=Pseudomonas TaxID=286 RepID=UPI000721219F|nr:MULTISPECIES: MMPL family transporter [Pseudomonas]ALQ02593.1 transport protein [Pseudomonas brassicacearum]